MRPRKLPATALGSWDIKITGWQRDTAMQDGDIRDGVDCGPRLVAVKTEGPQQKVMVAPLMP